MSKESDILNAMTDTGSKSIIHLAKSVDVSADPVKQQNAGNDIIMSIIRAGMPIIVKMVMDQSPIPPAAQQIVTHHIVSVLQKGMGGGGTMSVDIINAAQQLHQRMNSINSSDIINAAQQLHQNIIKKYMDKFTDMFRSLTKQLIEDTSMLGIKMYLICQILNSIDDYAVEVKVSKYLFIILFADHFKNGIRIFIENMKKLKTKQIVSK